MLPFGEGTATNITEATKEALRIFCTRNHDPPHVPADHRGFFDDALYDHIRKSIRALTVDAAGNEVASGENMSSAASCTAHDPGVEARSGRLLHAGQM